MLTLYVKTFALNRGIIDIGTDEYYVLGDKRDTSKDSRSFGVVKKDLMVGKYWFSPFKNRP